MAADPVFFFLIGWEHFEELEIRSCSSCWETKRSISSSDTTQGISIWGLLNLVGKKLFGPCLSHLRYLEVLLLEDSVSLSRINLSLWRRFSVLYRYSRYDG